MGATLTSGFQSPIGMGYTLVLAVEGIGTLYHSGETDAQTSIDDAWAGTGWALNRAGLQVHFDSDQSIEPWKADIGVSGMSFGIMDTDGSDTFGIMAFGGQAGVSTFLNADLDCNDTTVTVLSTAAFPSSGVIYIGTETISYSGKTGTTFTGCVRGNFAPFKANSEANQRLGRAHTLPTVGDGVVTKPKVSSLPRVWKGRWVGLWLHRKVGTALDTKAEAQCIWAGRIVGKRDEANGMTWMECEDIRASIRGCTLLSDQWTARVAEGIYLRAGNQFNCFDDAEGVIEEANPLNVVASGASGANEINAGRITIDELAEKLNEWFTAERVAGRLNFRWSYAPSVAIDDVGLRGVIRVSGVASNWDNRVSFSTEPAILDFLGFDGDLYTAINGPFQDFVSPHCPYRIYMLNEPTAETSLEVEDVRGTWFDNSGWFPDDISSADAGNELGLIQVNDGPMILAVQVDADTYQIAGRNHEIDALAGIPWDSNNIANWRAVPLDQDGEIRLKQVVVIEMPLRQLVNRLLMSTGTLNYNYAGIDVFPAQLGAAIPFEALGVPWDQSLALLPAADLRLVIDKPTRLLDKIGVEFAARFANVIWKNGTLIATTWGTPTTATASHAFTEANKATPFDTKDNLRTVTNETDRFLVNVVKIRFGRTSMNGEYAKTVTITDKSSISDHGERAPIEIEMCNSYARATASSTTAHMDAVIDNIANMMSIFSRPLYMMKRTIDLAYYEGVAPGDFATITDTFARNPSTGARGLSNKPCLIIGHRYGLGGYEIDTGSKGSAHGEVDLLLMPFDNIAAYCPAADVASYNAGTKVVTCAAHAYSESTEAADATRFPIGSVVRWIEIDPDAPGSPATDLDVVAAQSGNDITLTTGITGYSGSLSYRIISDEYANATTTQQVNVYQADDADGLVAAGVNAYAYGNDINTAGAFTEGSGLEQVALYATNYYGKGIPLDVGAERDIARLCNSLQNYRTAPVLHSMNRAVKSNASASVWTILEWFPVFVGPGDLAGGSRSIRVRPWFRSSNGSSVTVRVTVCRHPPQGSSRIITDADFPEYIIPDPKEQDTWTTSSTTWAAGSASDMGIGVADSEGIFYVIIEGTEDAETRGLCQGHVLGYAP